MKPSQNATLRRKVQEVRSIAEQDLGFAPTDDNGERQSASSCCTLYTYLLYIVQQRIVGLFATEKISKASAATPSTRKDGSVVSLSTSSSSSCKANLGVHLMWVHNKHRGKGIATKLLDMARERAVFGYTALPPNRVAFSSPTEAGLGFARNYMDKYKAPVLVYQYANNESR